MSHKTSQGYIEISLGRTSRAYEHRVVMERELGRPLVEALKRARQVRRVQTHCKHGHAWTTENTRVWRGLKFCRACDRARQIRRQRSWSERAAA